MKALLACLLVLAACGGPGVSKSGRLTRVDRYIGADGANVEVWHDSLTGVEIVTFQRGGAVLLPPRKEAGK